MADDDYVCNAFGECYTTNRWNDWGRWIFVAFMIIGFFLFVALLLARRRRRSGLKPIIGTAWLAPKNRFPTHHAMPGPPGPAGYYPPPPPGQEYNHNGNFYTPPPYTPHPQHTGTTTNTSNDAYYAPPPGPPPAHATGQSFEMAPQHGTGSPYYGPGSPAPAAPVSSHPTGASTHSYVQSNNPFQPPASPPPAHVTDVHGTEKH